MNATETPSERIRSGMHFATVDVKLYFEPSAPLRSFAEVSIDRYFYTARRRSFDEVLPWDHMDYGVTKRFLINENKKAHAGETTACCREKCAGCGANRLNGGVCDEIGKTVV